MRRMILAVLAIAALSTTVLAGAAAAGDRHDQLHAVREATEKFQRLDRALKAGYGVFYVCTDEDGLGAMGQHYVNGDLVGDAILDPKRPEALMYETKRNGKSRLVAVEWVVFKSAWEAAGHKKAPKLFGKTLKLVPEPNRYGIPTFYQLHAWVWKRNPTGTFEDWNPRVSCRGKGD